MKYHYFRSFFTYSVKRRAVVPSGSSGIVALQVGGATASPSIRSEDSVRRGV